MALTIDDLLNSLQNPNKVNILENSKNTWQRIANKDRFEELGLEFSELENFLKEFISNNPYSAIS